MKNTRNTVNKNNIVNINIKKLQSMYDISLKKMLRIITKLRESCPTVINNQGNHILDKHYFLFTCYKRNLLPNNSMI